MKLREKEIKGDTQKYFEIHVMNSDKAIGRYTLCPKYIRQVSA